MMKDHRREQFEAWAAKAFPFLVEDDDGARLAKVVAWCAWQAGIASAMQVGPSIRRDADGALDEIVGAGAYHLEQMSASHWWVAFYTGVGDARVTVHLQSKAKIKAHAQEEP